MVLFLLFQSMASSSSGVVPDVLPSQVLSASPSLPTNKLLDNLTVNFSFLFDLGRSFSICFFLLEKSKTFTVITAKL